MAVNTSPLSALVSKNPLDIDSDNFQLEADHNTMAMITENNLKLPDSY